MGRDTGNRSFVALVLIAGAAVVAAGTAACALAGILAYRVADDGVGALSGGEHDLRPALAVLLVIAAGTVRGAIALRSQLMASRRLVRRLRELRLPVTPALAEAARRTRLGRRVRMVDADPPFSFTYGAWAPRVAVSRGLVERVQPPELEAVLAHEGYHLRNLDPLKVLIARTLGAVVFYLPLVDGLHGRYVTARELAADRRAVRACGRAPLAGALLKVVRGPGWPELSTAAAIGGGDDLLGVRISQLESGREPRLGIPRWQLVLSGIVAAALVAGFVLSVVAAGGFAQMGRMEGGHEMDWRPRHVLGDAAWMAAAGGVAWLAWRRLAQRGGRRA